MPYKGIENCYYCGTKLKRVTNKSGEEYFCPNCGIIDETNGVVNTNSNGQSYIN